MSINNDLSYGLTNAPYRQNFGITYKKGALKNENAFKRVESNFEDLMSFYSVNKGSTTPASEPSFQNQEPFELVVPQSLTLLEDSDIADCMQFSEVLDLQNEFAIGEFELTDELAKQKENPIISTFKFIGNVIKDFFGEKTGSVEAPVEQAINPFSLVMDNQDILDEMNLPNVA